MHLIETSRLLLRRPSLDDAAALFAGYASQPEVVRYLPWDLHRTLADSKEFLRGLLEDQQAGLKETFAITCRAGGTFYGMIDLRSTLGRSELGYALDQQYWGRGIVPEAVEAMVCYAFQKSQVTRVQALTMPENRPSQRVLEKCGFAREGTLRQYQYFAKLGRSVDLVMWARLKN
jgi:[ribosomal protein S5]-alanine N-acetyltransferase